MSVFSKVSSFTFLSIPPAYPVRLPLVPTTLWQGIIIDILLCPTAPPTACADIRGSPFSAAISYGEAAKIPALCPKNRLSAIPLPAQG